jgi:site-specific DNA recombinase
MFMQQVLGIMAEEESRQLSVRVTASKQRRFKEGKWSVAPPFGYSNQKHETGGSVLAPNKDAPLIKELFARYASGNYSLMDLRRYLNECGVSKGRSGILYILKNRTYLGEVPHGRFSRSEFFPKPEATWSQGEHEPLIDPETFARVQARLEGNAHNRSGGPHPKFLFSGLVRCGLCGNKYTGRWTMNGHGTKMVQFKCGRRTGFGDCKSRSVLESVIRAAVIPPIERLLAQLNQEDVREGVKAELVRQQEESKAADQVKKLGLADEVKRLEARLSRLEETYLDGDIVRERYLVNRDAILPRLKELQAQLAARPHLALPDMEQFFAMADALEGQPPDDQEWREIIEGMVDRIVIEGRDIKVVWKEAFAPLLGLTTEG